MTRSGSAFALPTPEPRTAATASYSSPSGPGRPPGSRLLPTPVAGNYGDGADLPTGMARRDRQKQLGRNGNGIGTPLPAAIALLTAPMARDFGADRLSRPGPPVGGQAPDRPARRDHPPPHRPGTPAPGLAEPGEGRLLPTPDTGCSPKGHGRRGGPPGNGHQSGQGLDIAATALTPVQVAGSSQRAWAEYSQLAICRWEDRPRVPRAAARRAGAVGPARLSAPFAEWMMGIPPNLVTQVPGIPRTRQLKLIGNGVVPQQAALALRLLIEATAVPAPLAGGTRAARANRPRPR